MRWKRGIKHNALGRSRGGVSSKIHALVDGKARPLHLCLTPGQQHDSTKADVLIEHASGKAFLADTAYDSDRVRRALKKKKMRAAIPNSPFRKKKKFRLSKKLYANRFLVECSFHQLKRFRAVATRYEKTARNFLSVLCLAASTLWLN